MTSCLVCCAVTKNGYMVDSTSDCYRLEYLRRFHQQMNENSVVTYKYHEVKGNRWSEYGFDNIPLPQ